MGHTPIAEDEDARLLAKWKQSPLWPATDEQATSVTGPKDRLESLNNFCPEVAFDRFGLFASHLGRYADEIDSDTAHQRLGKEKAPANHPGWQWATIHPQHYAECPLYAPLNHNWPTLIGPASVTIATEPAGPAFDVFISHASEDKDAFVRPLAAELTRLGLRVWYDEATLSLGDSLRQKIDEGLAASTYGVVILSPAFFAKNWPQVELDALFAREMAGQKVILPVWHRLSQEQILQHSPLLAAKLATRSDRGVATVALEIFAIARPNTALPTSEPSRRSPAASNRAEPLA